jgi:hypothetical protein
MHQLFYQGLFPAYAAFPTIDSHHYCVPMGWFTWQMGIGITKSGISTQPTSLT